MRKGSITIFSVLAMMLTASVLFTLIEGARFQEIHHIAQLQTELAAESVFANYNKALWENYRLLACDYTEAESLLIEGGKGRESANKNGWNLLVAPVEKADIKEYTLLTDGEGAAYVKAVSSYMKENILYETAKGIYNQYEVLRHIKDTGDMDLTNIEAAMESLSALQKAAEELEKEKCSSTKGSDKEVENKKELAYTGPNPLQEAKKLQNFGILELVLEDKSQVSQKEIDPTNLVSQRELLQGTNDALEQTEWLDEVLLQQYLLTYLTNYCENSEGEGLSYELEYVIGGRSSDVENLKIVTTQLLGIREIANFLYLTSDVGKVEEAGLLAMALAGTSANPVIIEIVKIGLLTAWAFGESVLDVRALVQGKKIPLLKSGESWTLDLVSIGSISENYVSVKNWEGGLSYKDYLGILLLFQSEHALAMRSMDVQEMAIRSMEGQEAFQMDKLMTDIHAEVTYTYKPLFLFFSNIKMGDWQIKTTTNYGYDRRQVIKDVPLD